MYAIVEIAGQQFKVVKDQKVFVHRLKADEGEQVSFDKVLLIDNDGAVTVGAPVIDGAEVTAKVTAHLKGDKVIVFKKKRRKGYKVKNGHRQYLSEIKIESIVASGAKKKATPKKEEPKKVVAPVKEKAPEKKKTSKKGDDLTKVEGIGPKVKGIFNEAGIFTFADLAGKTPEELRDILAPKGGIYAGMTPDTWPAQAQLAADGKWDELKKWQDELDGGK
ncbi:MAG: 50S ribosomal protein L21 [Flavobacteriaceae bacterium]|nr:50S ribosomal protein L21 [Flavobacteriaceae bacterium]